MTFRRGKRRATARLCRRSVLRREICTKPPRPAAPKEAGMLLRCYAALRCILRNYFTVAILPAETRNFTCDSFRIMDLRLFRNVGLGRHQGRHPGKACRRQKINEKLR